MNSLQRFGRILSEYRDSYLRAVLVLALNAPIVALVLLCDVRDIQRNGTTLAYLAFVTLGYYALIPLVAITLAFSLSLLIRRLALLASGAVLALLIYYLVVDGIVSSIFKFHLDAFWLTHIFIDYDTMGIPPSVLAAALLLLVASAALQLGLLVLARRIRRPRRVALGFILAVLLCFFFSQAIHMVAYEKNQSQITALTPRLPLYFPLTWHRQASKYGTLLSWALGPSQSSAPQDPRGFRYPLRRPPCSSTSTKTPPNIVLLLLESWRYDAMNAAVSPSIDSLASRSSTFLRHFSSGNSTPTGVFGLFYGIHPTYWDAIKAQSGSIETPVFLDVLRSHGYALGLYSEHFERHKINDTIFRGIAVHDSFAGPTPDARDADMTHQLEDFVSDAARRHRPFMAFAFFKSTHYSYYYPPAYARFRPYRKLNVAMAGNRSMIDSYLNDYRNSVYYVDALVGHIVRRLEALGLMDNTIIVVTGDHSEEFDDDGAGYWGHASNFTEYQTHVPMVMYVPGQPPRRVREVTTHVDVPTTLIQAICGCDRDARAYSNGLNLFGPLPNQRPVVVSSYVNHAFIFGDDVYAVFPMYVQRYTLYDVKVQPAGSHPNLVRVALEEITRFSGGRADIAVARHPGQPPPQPPAHVAAHTRS